jgi:hypothetical protein
MCGYRVICCSIETDQIAKPTILNLCTLTPTRIVMGVRMQITALSVNVADGHFGTESIVYEEDVSGCLLRVPLGKHLRTYLTSRGRPMYAETQRS